MDISDIGTPAAIPGKQQRLRVTDRDPVLCMDVLLLTFGKYSGHIISDELNVPDDYLYWMLESDIFPDDVVEELYRRGRDPWNVADKQDDTAPLQF